MTNEQSTEFVSEVLTVCNSYLPPLDHPDRRATLWELNYLLTGIGMSMAECAAPGEGRWSAVKHAVGMRVRKPG